MKNVVVDKKSLEEVFKNVDALRDDLTRFCSDLVKMQSVNPLETVNAEEVIGGEKRNNEFIEKKMKAMGFKTELWEIIPLRSNLGATRKGVGEGKSLMFLGHIDTVPVTATERPKWKHDPWGGEIAEGKIWGRGAIDQKSGIAATVYAIEAIDRGGLKLKGDLTLLSTVGEESGEGGCEGVTTSGAGSAIDRGYRADACIVTEAVEDIWVAQPHLLWMKVVVKGKSAHVMFRRDVVHAGGLGAEVAVSAVDKGFKIYEALRELERQWGITKKHLKFPPGQFSISPCVVRGGPGEMETISFIPDIMTFEYGIWAHPSEPINQVKKEIEDCIKSVASWDEWMKDHPPEIEWKLWWPAFTIADDDPIVKTVATGIETVRQRPARLLGSPAVVDAPFIMKGNIPTCVNGVGGKGMNTAHAPNEFVEIDEMVTAAKIYTYAILDWCGYIA